MSGNAKMPMKKYAIEQMNAATEQMNAATEQMNAATEQWIRLKNALGRMDWTRKNNECMLAPITAL